MLRKIARERKISYGLCFLSALLLSLPFLNPKLSLFAWFGFAPSFLALKGKKGFSAFRLAYLSGLIFWFLTIYWLANVTLLGLVLLALYLALYSGLFGLFIADCQPPVNNYKLLFIPCLWVSLEFLRSHLLTGFPWALLGYSQYLNLEVVQVADITGAWGVSFLIMMVNVTIYSALSLRRSDFKKHGGRLLFPAVLLILVIGYGYYRINTLSRSAGRSHLKPVRISVIQPNIPQELKWSRYSGPFIMQRYFDLTRQAAGEDPDLIIWPEAALPAVLEEDLGYFFSLRDYIKSVGKPLLFGSVTSRDGLYYNSALLLSKDAVLLNKYDKLHLVPFGEYIPFRKLLRFLDTIAPIGDIARGDDYTIFKYPSDLGVLICFEDAFADLARGFVKKGARLLVNITNDAWFGKTPEACQHLAASVFRAIENRVYLARAANTGVSGFISPLGRIISSVGGKKEGAIFIQGYKTENLYISEPIPAIYIRYGDFFPVLCLLFVILSAPYALSRRSRKEGTS